MKYSKFLFSAGIAAALLTVSARNSGHSGTVSDTSVKDATKFTQDKNKEVYALLDFSDEQEKSFAEKGLIAAPESLELKDEKGKVFGARRPTALWRTRTRLPQSTPVCGGIPSLTIYTASLRWLTVSIRCGAMI